MKLSHLILTAIIATTMSCADSKPEEAVLFDKKMTETIAIHDEVMPEMSKINQLITKLETQMDSTNVDEYQPAIQDLKTGHDKMMTWMKSFGDEFDRTEINQGIQLKDADSLKQRIKVLEQSYQDAIDMKTAVFEAIANAQDVLDNK